MTMISFAIVPTFATPLITQGSHNGKIISTEIITKVRPHNETQFCVTWKIGDHTFIDKFKLWAAKETTRGYAQQKLNSLCQAAKVQMPATTAEGKVNFDASVLVGKQVKLVINQFEIAQGLNKGEKLPYIKKYESVAINDSEDEMIFNQDIPFN